MRRAGLMLLLTMASAASGGQGPSFEGRSSPVSEALAARMRGVSWRPGCPVALEALAHVRLRHWGYDGAVHDGELVVHRELAGEVVQIFRALFEARFPIEKVRLVEEYGGDDLASMADNNTSGFNCRKTPGSTRWSLHASGRAIDVNPRENPYVRGPQILPPSGAAHLARAPVPGLIQPGDACHQAFRRRGWAWGGAWRTLKDYQHFEKRAAQPAVPPSPKGGATRQS